MKRTTTLLFALGLAAWIADALIMWLGAAPLGHDEAQYAIAARDTLDGAEPRWFYLSTGMNRIAMLGNLMGGSELAMRLPTFLLGIGFILVVAELARRLFSPATAAWTVCVFAGARQTAKWSAELLSDMPAATCLLAGTLILVIELEREAPRWRIAFAAPLLAAAFYIRFASCVPIAILVAALALADWRTILRRPVPILATAALFILLLVPHALAARDATGSMLGILLESKSVPAQASFAAGLVTYVASNGFLFYGLLMPPILLAGVFAVARRQRRITVLWLVAIGNVIALGLISDAQARYIMYSTTLLAILGVDTIRVWIESRRERPRIVLGAVAGVAVLAAFAWTVWSLAGHASDRRDGMRGTLLAAEAIRADRTGKCWVIARHDTQLEWLTGCDSRGVVYGDAFAKGERVYLVRVETGGWQPVFDEYPWRKVTILEIPGMASVRRLDP